MYNYHFPKDFIIGTATAAYQIEGGREHLDSCIWDDFAKIPGKVHNFEDGAIACDSYNRVDEDVALLKQLNVKAYRFSICLTRVINENGEVLQEGINYYKYLICKLKENNIMPFVTLYHWDLPSYLQEKYGGWIADETVQWFVKYCEVVFNAFKNDVPFYITINEPFCVCHLGYAYGCHAPGICDEKQQLKASFNILKAHGLVVNLYKKLGYTGKIGICVNINDVRGHENTSESVVRLFKNKGMWWYFMPVATGKFPEDAFAFYKEKGLFDRYRDELEYIYTRYMLATYLKRTAKSKDKKRYKEAVRFAMSEVKKAFPEYKKNPYLKRGLKGLYLRCLNPLLANAVFYLERNRMN